MYHCTTAPSKQEYFIFRDSIIYVLRPGETDLPTGDTLGMLTDELKPGEFITEFCSTSAKSYSYITNFRNCSPKMKRFTLNREAKQVTNFSNMKAMLLEPSPRVLNVHYPFTIQRNERTLELRAVELNKKFKVNYDKRVILNDLSTVPFGYTVPL